MTAYGFRLFTVSAHPGRKHIDLELSDLIEASRSGSAASEMERHLRSIIDKPLFGRAAYLSTSEILPEDGVPDDTDLDSKKYPHVWVTQVKVQANRVTAWIYYGREGDYEWLLSQEGHPEPLGRRASANVYRVTFYFPTGGPDALLISETQDDLEVVGEAGDGFAIVVLSFLLLIVMFRSLLVPLIATLGFQLSLGASFGASVAVFQWGWLDPLIAAPQGDPMLSILPIILVGVLFGLAMDYQVFLAPASVRSTAEGWPRRTLSGPGWPRPAR